MPDISIVFCSRSRPAQLSDTLDILFSLAREPGEIEAIVAVDPDDTGTIQNVTLPEQARLWVAPQRYGYYRLHDYLNPLAKMAAGRWLMWWNDDMIMQTDEWDSVIREHRPAVLWPYANHVDHANIDPIWPKAWSDATGHAAPTSHMDTYWQYVGQSLNRHDRVPIHIFHNRADVTGNNYDQTYTEGRNTLGSEGMVPGFNAGELWQYVTNDARTIHEGGLLEWV